MAPDAGEQNLVEPGVARMNALISATDSIEAQRAGRKTWVAPAAWRNNVMLTLMFVSLLSIVVAGMSVGMDRYLSPRYWSYAIPSYFSEVAYGGARYTYFLELELQFVRHPPFSDPVTFHPLLWDVAARRVPVSGPPHFFPADEKGTVDFVRAAFAVFGIRVQSLYYLYCLLLALSLMAFAARFRRELETLFIGLLAIVALFVCVRTLSMTKELFSVTNPRAIGSLSVIALLHLALETLRRRRPTPATVVMAAFQSVLLVFVISMRTAEGWQVIALIGIAAIAAARRGTPSCRVSALWPAATTLACVAAFMVYQKCAYPQEYFSRNLRTKIVWHNVLIGFALHPGIADWYQLRVDDPSVLAYVTKKAQQDLSVRPDDVFWGPAETPDGIVKDFREYDRLCRNAVWDIVTAHPWQTLKLFVWHKPRLLVRSFEYATGHVTHDLNYYGLNDQAVSLFTPRERQAQGSFFNPLSPMPLLLVLAACLTAGVTRVKAALDVGTVAAMTAIVCASLVPAVVTYPLIHVIAGAYWAGALLFYVLAIRLAEKLPLLVGRRMSR